MNSIKSSSLAHRPALAVIVLLGIVAVVAGAWKHYQRLPASRPGERSFTASGWGYSLVLKCRSRTATDEDCASPPWGSDCGFGRAWLLVTSLRIWRGREEVEVPRSVFADLSDVDHVAISRHYAGCLILVSGADAGEAWDAEIEVRGSQVVRRQVSSGEFPEDIYEETRYVSKVPPDS